MYTFSNGQLFSTLYRPKRCFGVTLCGNGVSYARHSRYISGSSNVSEAPGKTKNEKKYFPEKLHLNVKPTLSATTQTWRGVPLGHHRVWHHRVWQG